jgi:hypothetical protein
MQIAIVLEKIPFSRLGAFLSLVISSVLYRPYPAWTRRIIVNDFGLLAVVFVPDHRGIAPSQRIEVWWEGRSLVILKLARAAHLISRIPANNRCGYRYRK